VVSGVWRVVRRRIRVRVRVWVWCEGEKIKEECVK
jgi:hypothetical protein